MQVSKYTSFGIVRGISSLFLPILNSQGTTKLINAGTNDCLNFAGRSMAATLCSMLHLTKTELVNEKLNSLA